MNILLTGGNGVLGKEISKKIPNCVSPSRDELDITDRKTVFEFIKKNEFDTVIHTAALTNIRECEINKQKAWNTNIIGTQNLVDALSAHNSNAELIYLSTACVFHGDEKMYSEKSLPNPINYYSLTKLIGETIVKSLSNHLIIRTNFVGKKKWPYEKAFTDRFGTYLFAEDVAIGIKEMYESNQNGLIHLVGNKILSMYELAKITTPGIKPMTLNDYSGPHVTVNMTLDSIDWKKYQISKF